MVTTSEWKTGRGVLGSLAPLLGEWVAEAESPQGPVRCRRSFRKVLGGRYVQLDVRWEFAGSTYEELAVYGKGEDGKLGFWSFTSDGKHSTGSLVDVSDIHARAIGFEAQMPAGLARTAYWPDGGDGFYWVVEARTKSGWRRFVEHHYRPQG